MADNNFSPEQLEIIRHRNSSVLVSAGAGCGKTYVLTKRLLEYLNPGSVIEGADPAELPAPESIERFMVITYTRAAAAELKARISQSISAEISKEERGKNRREVIDRLRTQSALLPRANIGTIHSVCSNVLREFGSIVDVRPGFKVIEDERAEALRTAVLAGVLEDRYANPEKYPGFIFLADTLGAGRDDSGLEKLVLEIYDKTRSQPRPDLWIQNQKDLLNTAWTDIALTPWGKELLSSARSKVMYIMNSLRELSDELSASEPVLAANAPVIDDMIAQISALSDALKPGPDCSWDNIRSKCVINAGKVRPTTKAADQFLAEKLKSVKKDSVEKLKKKVFTVFNTDGEKALAGLKLMAPALCALLDTVSAFDKEYSAVKAQNAYLDFSDLEHYAAKLLIKENGKRSDIAEILSGRFREIMVDEFQDVSNIQDSIFRAVSDNGRNLFLVGDVKQAIYRFRLADPGIFLNYYKSFEDFRTAATDPGSATASTAAPPANIRVPLRTNFRSRDTVLDAVNSIFSLIMSEEMGDVNYADPDQQLEVGDAAKYSGSAPRPELIIIGGGGETEAETSEADTGEGEAETPDSKRAEAAMVADTVFRIVNIEKPEILEDKTLRPVCYNDVAILLRSPKNVEDYYRTELEKRGIPVSSGTESGFFDAPEICWLRAMLSVIDNPYKDVELITLLRSPAFGCSPDELAEIRTATGNKDMKLFSALKLAAETKPRFADFLSRLNDLRQEARDLPVSRLVWELVCRTDMLALCAAMPDGEQHRARVLKFIELGSDFENSGYRGIHKFVCWLRRLEQKSDSIKLPMVSGKGVTIMSIHKSKGLEFPVVFVCGLGKQLNKEDTKNRVLMHPNLGLGSRVIDLEKWASYPGVANQAISRRLVREMVSEELRVLYVALTRARERLYLVGNCKNLDSFMKKLPALPQGSPLPPEWILEQQSLLPVLAAAVELDPKESVSLSCYYASGYKSYIEKEEQAGVFSADEEEKSACLTMLEKNLAFEYPHADCVELPSKVTATQLKQEAAPDPDSAYLLESEEGSHSIQVPVINSTGSLKNKSPNGSYISPEQAPLRLPDFSGKTAMLTGTDRGTATHIALQHLDLSKTGSPEEITSELARLTREGFLTAREADSVDVKALAAFFGSEAGQEIRSAAACEGGKGPQAAVSLRREFRFSLLTPARELLGRGGEESILLQGAVDCFVEYDSAITLIDYKTDRVFTEEEIMLRAEHYRRQLEIYASALQRICGKPVTKKIICFLTPGAAVTL